MVRVRGRAQGRAQVRVREKDDVAVEDVMVDLVIDEAALADVDAGGDRFYAFCAALAVYNPLR